MWMVDSLNNLNWCGQCGSMMSGDGNLKRYIWHDWNGRERPNDNSLGLTTGLECLSEGGEISWGLSHYSDQGNRGGPMLF